jgi:TolB-like protein/DNA-binding winged helix-turn-helix (wHTH) protein
VESRSRSLRFGDFEVDIAAGELRHLGSKVRLQEQPFQVLAALIERPHEVVTREELQKRLWSDDVVVDFDRGLNKAVNRLREALRDDADDPRFIETIPHRGYRFLVPVEAPSEEPSAEELNIALPTEKHLASRRFFLTAGAAAGLAGIPAVWFLRKKFASDKIQSIAVLPLVNLSGDPEQEYFSDGMTDELISGLARINSLRVISRTSVMRFKAEKSRSLPSIAHELNVDAIVEGTVARVGQRVRITIQLIRARDERHLLSEAYERELTDVLLIRSEVASAVANQIRLKLSEQQKAVSASGRSVDPRAYDAYLKGNFFLQQGIRGVLKSIDSFRQALAIDASQADAYVGLGEALSFAGIFGFRPSAETYLEARTMALKALAIDGSSAGAYNVLGDVSKGYDWDLSTAETEYKRALQLNPSHLLTRLWYAECLTRMDLFDRALEESARAIALDPVSPISHNNRSMLFYRARRFDESIQSSRQALELEPSFVNALWWQGLSFAGKQRYPDAIRCLKEALEMHGGTLFRSSLGYVYGCAGDRKGALGMLDEITNLSKTSFVSPIDFAVIYAGLGSSDLAFRSLDEAYRTRATRIHELHSPYFDALRGDTRYSDLEHRVGLPPNVHSPDHQ